MSEKLCTLRTQGGGGGGRYNETSLWTNSSATSDFAQQTVTLSDSIDNYKYIKVIWKGVKTATSDSEKGDTVIDVNTLKKQAAASYYTYQAVSAAISSVNYSRAYGYASSTSIQFYNCVKTTNGAAANSYCIPLEILGLNELKPGTDVGIVTNGASFSAKTSVTINCKVGDYIALGYGRSASGYSVYWNGTLLGQSSDFVTGYSLSTNNFMSIVKASQTSNTFSVASGATLTGGYQIFSLG